jgi:hypothetical protein
VQIARKLEGLSKFKMNNSKNTDAEIQQQEISQGSEQIGASTEESKCAENNSRIKESKNDEESKQASKPEPVLLCFGQVKQSNSGGLQKNFRNFRQAKKDEIKYRNYVAKQSHIDRKDPVFKKQLREKFLDTVKKYFGVPYAKRYWKEGEELYNAPIFLDCCALVRQAVLDLREDFGFSLDRWN